MGESKKIGQRQICFNMKENKATGHKDTFLASLFLLLGTFLAILRLGQKCLFFLVSDIKNMTQIFLLVFNFDKKQQNVFANFDDKRGFKNFQ